MNNGKKNRYCSRKKAKQSETEWNEINGNVFTDNDKT